MERRALINSIGVRIRRVNEKRSMSERWCVNPLDLSGTHFNYNKYKKTCCETIAEATVYVCLNIYMRWDE